MNTSQVDCNGQNDSTVINTCPAIASPDESELKTVDELTQTMTTATNLSKQTEKQTSLPRSQKAGSQLLGNFSKTSSNIELVRESILVASCKTLEDEYVSSAINLNDCLANHKGRFKWQRNGKGLAEAVNVKLIKHNKVLEANLSDMDGYETRRRIALDQQISNQDGKLVFLDNAVEDAPIQEDEGNAGETDAQLGPAQRLKRAEDWAVATLKLQLDSFALERLGYTMMYHEPDIAIEYFNRCEPGSDILWKSVGLATAFQNKDKHQLAMNSLQVALDGFRAKASQEDVKMVSKADRQEYSQYEDVTDLFTCLMRASEYQKALGNNTAAMDLVEEAVKNRPWECECRWRLLQDLCEDSQHARAQALFEDWKENTQLIDANTPSEFMLRNKSYLQPMIYASKGTTLQASVEEALKEAIRKAEVEYREEDNANLLYYLGIVFVSRSDSASIESAKKSWIDGISIGKDMDLGYESIYLDFSCKRLCGLFFESTIEQLNSQQKSAENLLSKLKEDITPWTLPSLESLNFIDQPMMYVASFALLVDQLETVKALLKRDMIDALSILSDDDIYNDDTGIQLLFRILLHIGDTMGAFTAYSLLERPATRARLQEKLKEQSEREKGKQSIGVEKSVDEAERLDNEKDIAEDTMPNGVIPNSLLPLDGGDEKEDKAEQKGDGEEEKEKEEEVIKSLYKDCEGCQEYIYCSVDVEMWWCKYCPNTAFCTPCKDKLRQNKLLRYACNPKHELVLIKHMEYEEDDLKLDNVRVGGSIRMEEVKVEGENEKENKTLTQLTRDGGEIMKLDQWIEILKKEWDITETMKIEGKLQQ